MYVPVVIIVAVVLALKTVANSAPPYTLNEFEGYLPGIYFEYVSPIHTKMDHWKLTITIDLKTIQPPSSYYDQIKSI